MTKLLCSKTEAAKMLNCGRETVRYLIAKGKIETFTLDGHTREQVLTKSIHNYLNGVVNGKECI